MTAAISAVRRQVREMVDGTLELRLHIEPKDKAEFHRLFPEIDMPVALAPLNPKAMNAAPAEPEKEKPGPLCMLCVKWCEDENFIKWFQDKYPHADRFQVADKYTIRQYLCKLLSIQSRRELDTNPEAANRFQTLIRLPYMKYQQTGEV
jgi:hypothetical protein